jgi:1-acyl-sn-glycerol-3-phosphate acyltransferase
VSKPKTFMAGNDLGSRITYFAFYWVIVPFTRIYTRMTINGRHHIPTTGPFVLAPIHRSYVDTPIAACVTSRRLRFMAKDTMWDNARVGWLLSMLGAFPVTRGTADREALNRCIAVLQSGEPLVLFPEGERKAGPVVQPLFDGAVFVAIKAGVSIVPVGIGGSEKVMPKNARLIYPRKVRVEIGAPIPPPVAPEGERLPRTVYKEQSRVLHAELQRLFDLAMEGVPWTYPSGSEVDQPVVIEKV